MLLAIPEDLPLARNASPGRGDLAAQKWIGVLQNENASRHDDFL
jgi:hypothetical protein